MKSNPQANRLLCAENKVLECLEFSSIFYSVLIKALFNISLTVSFKVEAFKFPANTLVFTVFDIFD